VIEQGARTGDRMIREFFDSWFFPGGFLMTKICAMVAAMNTAVQSVGAGRFYFYFGFPMPLAEEGLRAY